LGLKAKRGESRWKKDADVDADVVTTADADVDAVMEYSVVETAAVYGLY
jgi:hypothetical protein